MSFRFIRIHPFGILVSASMNQSKKFKTKNGYCHVLPDRIVFTHSDIYGQVGDLAGEGKMFRVLILYCFFALVAGYFSYFNFMQNAVFWFVLFAIIAVYLLYGVMLNLNTTLHPIIHRKQIVEVEYKEPKGKLSYPVFVVRFKNRKGDLKKRLITMPLATGKNEENNRDALGVMREEGLVSF